MSTTSPRGMTLSARIATSTTRQAGPDLLDKTDAWLPEHRERLYPPTVALSMFMKQALSQDRSCRRAVNAWVAQRSAEGLTVQSVRTGGYCRARQRLPAQMITALTQESGRLLSRRALKGWQWRGRVVKLADGTGISMPDTPAFRSRGGICRSEPYPSVQATRRNGEIQRKARPSLDSSGYESFFEKKLGCRRELNKTGREC